MSPSPLGSAKARHSIVEVATRTGIHIPPGRSGRVTVRCPMPSHGHVDSTPSLRIDLQRNTWWCFACSPVDSDGTPKAGDVIDWVQHTESVDWRRAIEILDSGTPLANAWAGTNATHHAVIAAAEADIPDVTRTPPERIQHALNAAWIYYTADRLHADGVTYLNGRGIDVTWLELHNRRFEVGHTARQSNGLVEWLRARGFGYDEIVDAGLAYRRPSDGYSCDFYRDRVLIPLRDRGENLCGFIGRNVGDSRWPKYKNPPRTARYNKSRDVYQPLPAPEQPGGRVIVVEGTIDAMAIAVAAIRSGRSDWFCPITQSGRELSPHQLRHALALHPSPPIISFDGDAPGRDSTVRLALATTRAGRDVSIAELPDGEDPASWIARHGPSGLSLWFPTDGEQRRSHPLSPPAPRAGLEVGHRGLAI